MAKGYIITFFQEYTKYRSKIGAKEQYRILLTVSFPDPMAKMQHALNVVVTDVNN